MIKIKVDHMKCRVEIGETNRSMSNTRSMSGSRASTNTHIIRCFKCREYNHFARECPTRQVSSVV